MCYKIKEGILIKNPKNDNTIKNKEAKNVIFSTTVMNIIYKNNNYNNFP